MEWGLPAGQVEELAEWGVRVREVVLVEIVSARSVVQSFFTKEVFLATTWTALSVALKW